MKANEAPERIWINLPQDLPCGHIDSNSIEYTRTDAFIEKASEWLRKTADKYIWYSDYAECPGDDTCGLTDDFIDDFKKYMKGE